MAGRVLLRWRWAVALLGVSGSLGLLACAPETLPGDPPSTQRDWPVAQLHEGGHVAAELTPGATHRWRLPLEAGDFLRLVVEQGGVDVELTWLDPAGEAVLTADRNIEQWGPELVMAVTETAGDHTLSIRAAEYSGGRYEARIEALRPATDADRLAARTYRRFRQAEDLSREEAKAVWEEALEAWRELDEPLLEGEVLSQMGRDPSFRDPAEAAEHSRAAAKALARAGQHRWEAIARSDAAINLWVLGEPETVERAVEQYEMVRDLARKIEDPLVEGKALNGLGLAYRRWGEIQESLAHYEAALETLPRDDVTVRPHVLHNLGVLHSLYFEDHERAVELLTSARDAWSPEDPSYARYKARSVNQLGRIALEQGRFEEARNHFEAALALRQDEDPCAQAVTLGRLAFVEAAGGRSPVANAHRDEALDLVERNGCPREEPTVHVLAAELAQIRGNHAEALERFGTARARADELADPTLLAESLVGIARTRRARGDLPAALKASRQALELAQDLRPTVLREDLRTAFFATVQDRFDLHVGILTELGRHREAWATAEAARAQALRDLLVEAGAGLRRVAEPELVERERRLRRRLSYAQSRGRPRQAEIAALVEALERVRAEIRRGSPRYAELTQPRLLTVEAAQRDLLDDDILLLEYRLGSEESWLWAVSRDTFSAHVLPPRGEIEPLTREAAGWLQSLEWPGETPEVLCELSRKVLGPVASELGSRRLVLVPDGALESVSFAALPIPMEAPCIQAPPLVARHEIVSLPSVGALAAQRRLHAARPPAPGWVAVVADPVYGPEDPRLETPPRVPVSRGLSRLTHSGREAEEIRRLAPERVRTFSGFEASKQTILEEGSWASHRVLHFAVHGLLAPDRPLLSRLVLSRFTRRGEPVEGSLYAHEIYDLDLPAELTVLSACDTARGRWIAGEGVVAGLPRAFLYAGSQRVLVSLWAVQDRSTSEMMEAFYEHLMDPGQPPGRALQQAQRELWQANRPPRQWAGFVLQGDWRPLSPWDR